MFLYKVVVLFLLVLQLLYFLKWSLKKTMKATEGEMKSFQSISSYLFPYSVVYMFYLWNKKIKVY